MDIFKFPQFQLYLLTLNLLNFKDELIPNSADEWCFNATVINRAYFSSYLFCELWLDFVNNFRPIPLDDFDDEIKISEHVQVRNALENFGEKQVKFDLLKLSKLRKKADYSPFSDLTPEDVNNAIYHMENIFNHLKF